MLVLLFPGQGSQSPGMLLPWLDLPGARARVEAWSDLTGLDLLGLGTTGTAEQVRDTAVAQPLLTVAALLTADPVLRAGAPDAVCGHSIGELPALAVAGVLSYDDAVLLAARRGAALAEAAARRPTGMAAVLGGDEDAVRAAVADAGLEVATVNVAGQLVVGGDTDALTALAAARPGGARVRPLDVAGAFHTAAMAPAREAFATAVSGLDVQAPRCRVVANADGAVVTDPQEIVERLVAQLTGPVRFDRCLETLAAEGATRLVELAPGGTLVALARRALPDAATVAVRTPADLDAVAGVPA